MQKRKLRKFFLIRIFIPLPFSRIIQKTLNNFKPHIPPFLFNLVINEKFYVQQFKTQYKYNAYFFFNFIQFKGLNSRDFSLMLCNLIWTAFPYTVKKKLFTLDSLVRCYNKSKPFRTYVWISQKHLFEKTLLIPESRYVHWFLLIPCMCH